MAFVLGFLVFAAMGWLVWEVVKARKVKKRLDAWSWADLLAMRDIILQSNVLGPYCNGNAACLEQMAGCMASQISRNIDSFRDWKTKQGSNPISLPVLGTDSDWVTKCAPKVPWTLPDRMALRDLIVRSKVLAQACQSDNDINCQAKLAQCLVDVIATRVPSYKEWIDRQGLQPLRLPLLGTDAMTLGQCQAAATPWSATDKMMMINLLVDSKVLDADCRASNDLYCRQKLAACITDVISKRFPNLAEWRRQQGNSPIVMPILGTDMSTLAQCKGRPFM
jgi:hypothetical protein